MALAAQQSLLDELMGKGRNAAKGEKVQKLRFDDPNVCKYMLVDFCPHDLFANTRQDLGACDKIHDFSLRQDYENSSRYGKLGYEDEYERYFKSLLSDVERRIKRGQERLRITQGDPNAENDPHSLKNETITKIKELEEKITTHVLKSECLGNDCRIDEAQQVLNECEEMREEKKKLELQLAEEQANANMNKAMEVCTVCGSFLNDCRIDEAQQVLNECEEMREEKKKLELQLAEEQANANMNKAMEVCTVCGSFLIIGDIQSRLDEHNSGKQHAGYAKIKASLEEIIQRKNQMVEKERTRTAEKQETSNRKRDRSKSKDEKSKRHHSPSSNHQHHRDRNTKQRESSREKTDHHHHHHHHHRSSSRHENHSSSKERHPSPSINHQLEEKITTHVLKSECLGNDCRIDEAQQVLNECEEMREEKKKLELQLAEEQANANMNKAMEVCTVCGSFLIIGDIQSRLDEHNSGKQHAGYAKIKASLEEIIQRKNQMVEKERTRTAEKQETSNRKRDRSKSKDEKSKRHHSPSSNHQHHRDRNTKQRESSREKTDHHHHHHHHHRSSSRHENHSSSKERHPSPSINHRHHRR
ncbi:unnamed protein product [Adineta steineri]|uniref:Luc7-like protein 3 n=1 Tax=Adineta steineri TaxID=433720 RepID=A0A815CCW6_9BILA|nr:unnamed protein product [Adineta steineri]